MNKGLSEDNGVFFIVVVLSEDNGKIKIFSFLKKSK